MGGLNWSTTDGAFKEFFEKFGEVEECTVMRDKLTGTSRGFGFVVFRDPSAVETALNAGDLELDTRKIDCKRAVPKEQLGGAGSYPIQSPRAPVNDGTLKTKKIFVGGLLPETTETEFKAYFATFGEVTEAVIMMDHHSSRSRGFGFISFESEDVVDTVCSNTGHEISGKVIDCKKAVPKVRSAGPLGGGFRGGMRGGGRGGYGVPAGRGGYGGYGVPYTPPYGYPPPQYPPHDAYAAYPASAPEYRGYYGGEEAAYGQEQWAPPQAGEGAQGWGTETYGAVDASRGARSDRSFHPYR